ncbi:hypothetical protein [Tateyamaria sp. SN6-1]|uniref:hypothetical protein n=1 Tax=Tateyamaria sp. SN6-1 TaxID=3092148 RepID=UPI0039F5BF88
MRSFQEAFARASRVPGSPYRTAELYSAERVPVDLSAVPENERHLVRATTQTVYDWIVTCPCLLRWQDAGGDGTITRGTVGMFTTFLPPINDLDLPHILQVDGQWLRVAEVLSLDPLQVSHRLQVVRWPEREPPTIRSAPP